MEIDYFRFIREKAERGKKLTGFPPKTCGNDKQKQSLNIVILGLDPGIQAVFNLNTKDTYFLMPMKSFCVIIWSRRWS
ncbi:MAG: hypothetical protein A2X59_10015 [Nitrospirae bacterium GWC2_42_7]|nr:MAG: hypothetical protein A2X59_10015 [Nitrospirae bacterium GWC2_42_7]